MIFRILLILLLLINPAMAKKSGENRDPFNASTSKISSTQERENPQENIAQVEKYNPISTRINAKNCVKDQEIIAQNQSFQQLILIGAIQQKNGGKVLFRDPQNNVFIVSTGEFIGLEQMKLTQVSNKNLEFIGWNADCTPDNPLTIDF